MVHFPLSEKIGSVAFDSIRTPTIDMYQQLIPCKRVNDIEVTGKMSENTHQTERLISMTWL